MSQQWSVFLSLGVYVVVFPGAVAAVGYWRIKRQRLKRPLEFKLLRGPGESLRQSMNKFDEDLPLHLLGAIMGPLVWAMLVLGALIQFWPHMRLSYGLTIIGIATIPALIAGGWWLLSGLFRQRDYHLGYLGERLVAESLGPLVSGGYRVFHDVPAEEKKNKFNIDHVAVGPHGVFAIETKTRRKGRTRPGFEAHKVTYDGRRLIWPWAEDDFGLKNAEDRARWLSNWLNKMTGLGLNAQPVLALPGWYVVPQGRGPVMVENHKNLCAAITRNQTRVLTDQQIDLIARQLDEVCRDVED